jgi:hypothetical protein
MANLAVRDVDHGGSMTRVIEDAHAALVPNGAEGEVVLFGGDEHWGVQQESGPRPKK